MRKKRILEIFFEFTNSKDKKTLKQKFHDYSHEIAIKNIKKMIKLRQTKLTFKKKIITFLSRSFHIRRNRIKGEAAAFTSR